jgi:hypothetical protein
LGEKRAIPFLTPVILLFVFYVYNRKYLIKRELPAVRTPLRTFFIIVVISLLGLYAGAKTQYSLNPEEKRGGRFSLPYMVKTAVSYETEGKTAAGESAGRISTTVHVFKLLTEQSKLLLGFGPGYLTESSLIKRKALQTYQELKIERGKTGLLWIMLQIGILGAIFFLLFYLSIFNKVYKLFMALTDKVWEPFILGVVGVAFVFILDYVIYSTSTMILGVLNPIFYYCVAVCLKVTGKQESS